MLNRLPFPYSESDCRDEGLEALDRGDWTDLWSQLMQELRTGVQVYFAILKDKQLSILAAEEGWTVKQSSVRVRSHSL